MDCYTVKVGEPSPADGKRPSAGPVYRSIYAKDGILELPDEINSPWDFFSASVNKYPKNQMLGRRHRHADGKAAGEYAWETYEQVYHKVMKIGSAMLKSIDTRPVDGTHCGIYGSNCPEWVMAMEACNSQGICYVPLYDSLGTNAVEFIISHAEISIAFVQESKISSIFMCLPKCAAYLKTIVSFGSVTDEQKNEAECSNVTCFSWEEFLSLGDESPSLPAKHKDDICTIMYTSGTTGDPKGVIIKNRAVIAQVMTTDHLLLVTDKVVSSSDSYFSFLPLAHIFDQIMENYSIYKGASIGFWQGDARLLMEDVQELKPTIFCGVPRIYDRLYTSIIQKISAGGAVSKTLYQYAYHYKLRNLRRGLKQHEASPFFDKLVFSKIRQALGGRVRLMISGAAPLPKHVEEFMRVTSGSVFVQGYGLTENAGGSFTSIANVFSMMGTVGVPVTTCEARLESVPEMGYDALGDVARGEICLRGSTLFSGYHKRPDLTDEVLYDGWLHTGDIGEWQRDDGVMKIIDRKKNIFKLSQGEYVAAEVAESAYSQCPLVASVWVYGNSFESFLVAVAVPEKAGLEDWAHDNNASGTFEELCSNPKARRHVLDELNNTGRKLGLKGFEILKGVHLEPAPFSLEKDLITPTFKLKRSQLLKHFQRQIDELYREAKACSPH